MPDQLPILPRWGTSAAADLTEPSEALKDDGWVGGASPDRPAAQHFNWILHQNYLTHLFWENFLLFRPSSDWIAKYDVLKGDTSQPATCNGMAYSPTQDIFVAVGDGFVSSNARGLISSSPDGVTWTNRLQYSGSLPAIGEFRGVKWLSGPALFVAWGVNTTTNYPIFYNSADGITWAQSVGALVGATEVYDCAYDEVSGSLIAVCDNSIYHTLNILTPSWAVTGANAANGVNGYRKIAVNGTGTAIVSGNTGKYVRSTDGFVTNPSAVVHSHAMQDIIWDSVGGRFVGVGVSGGYVLLQYSTAGVLTGDWTDVDYTVHNLTESLTNEIMLAVNPDYGHLVMTSDSRIWRISLGAGTPFSEGGTPVGSLWTSAVNNYFRPFWNTQPAAKVSRYWFLGGVQTDGLSTNNVLVRSQVPIF